MIFALAWGWYAYDGDISYGRLTRIPYQEIQWYHVAPAILLLLTRTGIPVSTTFLVLSAFASTVVLENVVKKCSWLWFSSNGCLYCFDSSIKIYQRKVR